MKRSLLLLLIGALLVVGCSEDSDNPADTQTSDSQLIMDTFTSTALSEEREVYVYLPAGYDDAENASTEYPVIIFLHGAGTPPAPSYTTYLKASADALIDGGAGEFILIAPDALGGPYGSPFYTNSVLNGAYEDYIVNDVIDYVDANYRTAGTADERAIMGHSMGAYGAMKIALTHADMFRTVATHSGPLDFTQATNLVPYLLAENGGSGPFVPADTLQITGLFFAMASAFSPNLTADPLYVDLPVANDGSIIDSIFVKWIAQSPAHLAQSYNTSEELNIFFDCGNEDELLLAVHNSSFADTLSSLGIDYTYQTYTGTHSSPVTDGRFSVSLAYIDSVFSVPTSTMAMGN